jgi:hypothetical protein
MAKMAASVKYHRKRRYRNIFMASKIMKYQRRQWRRRYENEGGEEMKAA